MRCVHGRLGRHLTVSAFSMIAQLLALPAARASCPGDLTAASLTTPSTSQWAANTNPFLTKLEFVCDGGAGAATAFGCSGDAHVKGASETAHYAKAHLGVDYGFIGSPSAEGFGAIGPGEVIAACSSSSCTTRSIAGFVVLKHTCAPKLCGSDRAVYSVYMHLAKASMPSLSPGSCVTSGEVLGRRATGSEVIWDPHIHLEFRETAPQSFGNDGYAGNDWYALLPPGASEWGTKVGYALPRQVETTPILDQYLDPLLFFNLVRGESVGTVAAPTDLALSTHDDTCPGCRDETNWTYAFTEDEEDEIGLYTARSPYSVVQWVEPGNLPRAAYYVVTFEGGKRCKTFRGRRFCAVERETPATKFTVEATGSLGSAAASFGVPSAPPAGDRPPLVVTSTTSGTRRSSTTVNGQVTPRGVVSALFEILLNGQVIRVTPAKRISGTRPKKMRRHLGDLVCGTGYQFRVRADPAAGPSVLGKLKRFQTKLCRVKAAGRSPSAVVQVPAQPPLRLERLDCDHIGLGWAGEPDVDYEVLRGGLLLASADSSDEPASAEFADTEGLVPGSTYLYTLTARNDAGTSQSSLAVTYPRHICALPDQPITEFLAWGPRGSPQCDGASPAALIEWSTLHDGEALFDLLVGPGASYLTSVDSGTDGAHGVVTQGLSPVPTVQEIRVRGRDSLAASVDTAPALVRSFSARCDPLARWAESRPGPFLSWAEPVFCHEGNPAVRIHWTQSSGAVAYRLERLHPSGTTEWFDLAGGVFEDDSGLVPGADYIYRVTAQSAAGESEAPLTRVFIPSDTCSSDGLPGEVVLFASEPYCSNGAGAVDLYWYPSKDDDLNPRHRNIRTDLEGFGSVNTAIQEGPRFQTTKTNLEPRRVYGYFIQVELAADATKRRESNRVFFAVPENPCGLPPGTLAVTTAPPLMVSPSTAVLAADITPAGVDADAWLEWGEAAAFDQRTTRLPVGSGWRSIPLQPLIAGLRCGTTYRFRGAAQRAGGPVVVGSEMSFTAPACAPSPPGIVTGAAMYRQRTKATITGVVNPNGLDTSARFEWGVDSSYGQAWDLGTLVAGPGIPVSARLTGLACGSEYHFRLVGSNGAGAASGADRTFRTLSCSDPDPGAASSFYTLTPCRVEDTRSAAPLASGIALLWGLHGKCGIPVDATAIIANLTVVGPSSGGHLEIVPRGEPPGGTSVINFRTGQTRANNAIIALGTDGEIEVKAVLGSGGTVDLVLDVAGFFRP